MKPLILLLMLACVTACTSIQPMTATPSPTAPATATPAATATTVVEAAGPTLVMGQWHETFYDSRLQKVLLLNGAPEDAPADRAMEVWEWTGETWKLLSSEGPAWRNFAAAAYDPVRSVLVMTGGVQVRGRYVDETWLWDGQGWTPVDGPGPGAREGALMVFDWDRERMVLFGGASSTEAYSDTWEWDGSTWMQVSSTGPAPRFAGGMVYDAARSLTLIYSGHLDEIYQDLWAWDGATWREIEMSEPTPGVRFGTTMNFDAYTQQVLLVSGSSDEFMADVWSWDGAQWAELPITGTPARSGLNVVFNPAQNHYLLTGGVDRPGGSALSDTWALIDTAWVCLNGCL